MLRPTPPRHRWLLALALIAALIVRAPTSLARAAPASAVVSASPSTLSVSIPLGQTLTQSITLVNSSGAALTPAIYEAWPQPATPAATRPAGLARVALPDQPARLDPRLLADLRAAPDQRADFIIYMRNQADLSAAYTFADWAERGRYVYQTLTDWAAREQSQLRQQIAARGMSYRPFWIVNAVLVHGTLADAQALAQRGDVALVGANRQTALADARQQQAVPSACNADQPSSPICWNIRKIGADRVWREIGVTGQGIVVASTDTGVSYSHPALSASYRGYQGPGRYDHNYNWFDPLNGTQAPQDGGYHGTHTMGTIAGAGNGTTAQPSIGVAPGARWISAAGCSTFNCSQADLLAAAQWMLAPTALDGSRPRPDLRPMIVNNSWAGAGGDPWYAGYTLAWRAAGIFPVFSAGNTGDGTAQVCRSIKSPGDYGDVVAVGATAQNDTVTGFSLLGPAADGRTKPDFSAPGKDIVSAAPGGLAYRQLDGTSMAAPHIAGVVALLWSANPALIGDYDTTYAILRDTAKRLSDTRCGDPAGGPNNVYGQGRVDAFAAVARARVDVPWLIAPTSLQPLAARGSASFNVVLDAARVPGPGTYKARLQVYGGDLSQPPTTIAITLSVTAKASQAAVGGQVVSAEDGAPLKAVVEIRGGPRVETDKTGVYTLTLTPGDYVLTASAPSFLASQRAISVAASQRLTDIELLPDQPRLALATPTLSTTLAFGERRTIAIPIDNHGARPLYYQVSLPHDQFGVWRSDEPGGPTYSWIDLPASAPKLTLATNSYTGELPLKMEFPLFSYSYTETIVTSNGTLGFSEPLPGYTGPTSRCLPGFEIPFDLIAPFRADLDPSRGGAIRYSTLPDRKTFVLSYENVPLHSGPPGNTYTFQVLLHSDGRIGFQYKKLAALPNKLSVGVQYAPSQTQQIGCGAAAPLHDGLAIELRPQTSSDLWLASGDTEGVILPGGQQVISVSLAWQRPTRPGPLRAQIAISSSDPTHPSVAVPVQIAMQPAKYERWLLPVYR